MIAPLPGHHGPTHARVGSEDSTRAGGQWGKGALWGSASHETQAPQPRGHSLAKTVGPGPHSEIWLPLREVVPMGERATLEKWGLGNPNTPQQVSTQLSFPQQTEWPGLSS